MKTYIQPQTAMFELRTAEHILNVSTQDSGSTLNVSIGQSGSTVGSSDNIWTREKQGGGNSGMWSDMQ